MAKPKPKVEVQRIEIPEIKKKTIEITLVGDSPLICHRWSEKAKKEILDKQMKAPKSPRPAKDPEADYKASLYPHPDGGYGFPAVAFKSSAVDACTHVDGMTKVAARGVFHIEGELVKIIGTPRMRRDSAGSPGDMVRVGMGQADIHFRGEFPDWRAKLRVSFLDGLFSAAQIINLFNIAGFAVGIGEWRPEKNGIYGRFHVEVESA